MLPVNIVDTYVDNHNIHVEIISEQYYNERLAEIEWNNCTKETIVIKTQPRDRTHLTSDFVVATVLVLLMFLIQRMIA